MALAILEEIGIEGANIRFHIDTGTSQYYQLKIGRSVQRRNGLDWVDDVFFTTSVSVNESAGDLFNSSKEVSIMAPGSDKGDVYVQLFSYKTPRGKSPAFSIPIRVHTGINPFGKLPNDYSLPYSISGSMNTMLSFQPSRMVPCRTYREMYAQQASLEDFLGGILKLAGPILLNLLSGSQNGTKSGSSSGGVDTGGRTGQTDLLAQLLKILVGSLAGERGQVISQQQSIFTPDLQTNRFLDPDGQNTQFSQPFFWQAILQAVAGELVKIAPELMNLANQRRVQMKQADNKLITDILSQINQPRLLEQLLQAQQQQPLGNQSSDLNQLIQLLQQVPASPASAPAVAATQSLSWNENHSFTLSSKTVISFVTGASVTWNGMQKILFAKSQEMQLKIQLSVVEPIPKAPLPKAILKFTFKELDSQSILFEKIFKQKNILPNSPMVFSFSMDELARLPTHRPINVFVECRWLNSKSGKEYKALGFIEVVLVNKYFLKETGGVSLEEHELTDMKRFRPFWNKIWDSPVLDVADSRSQAQKKLLWALDLNTKYSVLLSPDHEANGLMKTKLLQGPADEGSLTAKTEGRMKAGIELSISELNKLIPLWAGAPVLDRQHLEAFQTGPFAKNNSGEFIYHFKLNGKARERGMVWVIPVFQLFDFIVAAVQKTDDSGQITAVNEEKVNFPLPVSARVIGLKSQ